MKYNHIVVGGTFDGLHAGHVHFLTQAFSKGLWVTIGLTSEAYIRRFKKDAGVTPFSKRYEALTAWLRKEGFAERTTIVRLDNKWGPVLLPDGFDSIAVTKDNRHTALEINTVRTERGLPPLAIIEVDLVPAEDNRTISSTRIRRGEIDAKGNLRVPDSLRITLAKPLGRILAPFEIKPSMDRHKDAVIISVGDVTTETVFLCGIQPSLAIVDLQVERKPYQSLEAFKFPKKYTMRRVRSGPGYISQSAVKEILRWSRGIKDRKRVVIVVEGEEDLLALHSILHAPLGSFVYYGSPPISGTEGLVEVEVTKAMKRTVRYLIAQFV